MSDVNVYQRLNQYMQMVYSACNLPVWCYGMASRKRFFSSCPDTEEFEQFLKLSGCLDYAYDQVEDMKRPVLLSDSLGMLYIADYVWEEQNAAPSLLILLGPYFDSEDYVQDVLRALNREDLSVQTRLRMKQTFREIPVITQDVADQYAAMLQCSIEGEPVVFKGLQYMKKEVQAAAPESSYNAGGEENQRETLQRFGVEDVLKAVRDGDIAFMNRMKKEAGAAFMQIPPAEEKSGFRMGKDRGIVYITICSLSARDGGLNALTAETLRDRYIDEIERAETIPQTMSVMRDALKDFIQKVHDVNQKGNEISQPIQKVRELIRLHAEGEIELSSLAKEVGYTEYYLTKKFSKEVGMKLSDYIKKEKIDLARIRLLTTTKSIEEISDSLGFANRGYFSRVFREQTGMTPSAYRLRSSRISSE